MRCEWANQNETMIEYHDNEYGVFSRDTEQIYEHMCLEIMCTGLSFNTALQKRESLKTYFASYELLEIIKFDEDKINEGLQNPGIIRNRQKVTALINNAKVILEIEKYQTFYEYLISKLDYRNGIDILVKNLTKQLKKDGFKFMGQSVCESLLIALGFIPGHSETCKFNKNKQEGSFVVPTVFGNLAVTYDDFYKLTSSNLIDTFDQSAELSPIEQVISDKISLYTTGKVDYHLLNLKPYGTEFQKAVIDVVVNSKPCSLMTYKDIGLKINSGGFRAVGTVLHNNRFTVLVPAYRVVTGQAIKNEQHIPEHKLKFILQERKNHEKNL